MKRRISIQTQNHVLSKAKDLTKNSKLSLPCPGGPSLPRFTLHETCPPKADSIADTNNIYYYNNNWQVLCDYNDSGTLQRWFAYGNYIDEVLLSGSESTFYYIHDHLYSPVALITTAGAVSERYEYDAYGNCQILNASYEPRATSDYKNPYLFTGRRVDILDNGSLTIQYNRNRYYDQYTAKMADTRPTRLCGWDESL